MRTHTTLTDIRRICRLHSDGLNTDEICNETYISKSEIKRIISVKFPAEKAAPKKKAAKKSVDPTS